MAKSKTASYVLTLQLKTEKFQEDILNNRLEKCRKIYNSCLGKALICGEVINRDENAAINIMNVGLSMV